MFILGDREVEIPEILDVRLKSKGHEPLNERERIIIRSLCELLKIEITDVEE